MEPMAMASLRVMRLLPRLYPASYRGSKIMAKKTHHAVQHEHVKASVKKPVLVNPKDIPSYDLSGLAGRAVGTRDLLLEPEMASYEVISPGSSNS